MRVTSEFWIAALVRRVFADGGFAAVLRRGAAEAGAVFVLVRERDGTVGLYGPAPQNAYETGRPADRAFLRLPAATSEEAEAKLKREERFDSDLWVVEIEPGRTAAEALFPVTPA